METTYSGFLTRDNCLALKRCHDSCRVCPALLYTKCNISMYSKLQYPPPPHPGSGGAVSSPLVRTRLVRGYTAPGGGGVWLHPLGSWGRLRTAPPPLVSIYSSSKTEISSLRRQDLRGIILAQILCIVLSLYPSSEYGEVVFSNLGNLQFCRNLEMLRKLLSLCYSF